AAPPVTANGPRERRNSPTPLPEEVAGRAHGPGGGMGPEAKAPGRAGGYADGAHERMEGRDARRRDLLSTPATGVQRGRGRRGLAAGGGGCRAPRRRAAAPGPGGPWRSGRKAARGAVPGAVRRGAG